MPSIEGGGVEKNLFIISNYLVDKIKDISLITISNSFKHKFNKKIRFISLKGDKSISHRLLMIASIINNESKIENISLCKDVQTTIECLKQCNVLITRAQARFSRSRQFSRKLETG